MSEQSMIERVARAIYGEDTLDGLGSSVTSIMLHKAQEAIKAMREPTNFMLVEATENAGPIDCCSVDEKGAKEVWQAMIDAALVGEG
ncbi:hypothetical protein [Sphingobium yanoikuyae]|uniref:hypothetical protein n=1 Tax=Sphingobium yanoikuyae TaxID=13690 RepID=UPI0035C71E3D